MIETMAQIGIVALGLHLVSTDSTIQQEELTFLFSEAKCEFFGIVRPNDRVTISAKKKYFRRLKLKVDATMTLENGREVCRGTLAGMGVTV